MNQREHFGMIGLKIGERIKFRDCEDVFIVSSGNGTPDNGGTLVRREKSRKKNYYYSLRSMTRRMLGLGELPEQIDIWSYWSNEGATLREMLNKAAENVNENETRS